MWMILTPKIVHEGGGVEACELTTQSGGVSTVAEVGRQAGDIDEGILVDTGRCQGHTEWGTPHKRTHKHHHGTHNHDL